MERYLWHRRQREEQILGVLANGAHGARQLLAAVYADVDDAVLGYAARSLQAGLEKLLEEGRIVARDETWELAE